MEWEATVNRRRVRLTREQVIEALRGVKPGRIQGHAVEVEGTWYPVKQAFAVASGVARLDFRTIQARHALERLGFTISEPQSGRVGEDAQGRPSLRPPPDFFYCLPQEEEVLEVRPILLEWEWWDDLRDDQRTGEGVGVPRASGVYEVRIHDREERLYIGKAADLQARVKHAMVNGVSQHAAGRKIETNEDTSRVCVRWALTDRPATAEAELQYRYVKRFGVLPKYNEHT